MADDPHLLTPTEDSISSTARRLARLLGGGDGGLRDPTASQLQFETTLGLHPLTVGADPPEVWAVDGGQGLVADARCLQVYVTRAARVRWVPRDRRMAEEEVGPLSAHLLGLGEDRATLAALSSPVAADAVVDVNLLRDWGEWSMVSSCVEAGAPGAIVLVDGDLQPDWRIPAWWLADLFATAAAREVILVGVTKHTSLSWGGAPLLGVLERMAADPVGGIGARTCWWAPIARTRGEIEPGIQVVVARLDPDARFAFRLDMPGHVDPATVLGSVATLCSDAAFPGYPYPLSAADRLAACPRWVREEAWSAIEEVFDQRGLDPEIVERAFADRHRLMERS